MTGTRVYLGRINYDVRERDIEKFFKGYGRIREILLKDGFAFVVSTFVQCCLNLNNSYLPLFFFCLGI